MTKGRTDIAWCKLDPAKADYGAVEGAYIGGNVVLVSADRGRFIICGHMTCGTLASAEMHADKLRGVRGDRHVSRKTFVTWIKGEKP